MLNKNLKKKKISSSVLAIIILILLLVCSFVLLFEINDYRNIADETENFYYYFASTRVDFEADITINSKDRVLNVSNESITLTSSPLYYSDSDDQMLLPKNMEIVFPYKVNPMYKLGSFSKIFYRGNYLYINAEIGIGRLYDCFLYDGQDLYVFLENTTIFVGGERYDLNPMSFVEVTQNSVEIYNKKTDTHTYLQIDNQKVNAYTDEYSINLSEDTFTYQTSYYLLIKNPDALQFYEF